MFDACTTGLPTVQVEWHKSGQERELTLSGRVWFKCFFVINLESEILMMSMEVKSSS